MYTNAIIVKSHAVWKIFAVCLIIIIMAFKKYISKDTQTKGINGVETLPIIA